MLTLTKSLFALMIGFILSTVFGYFLIPILKKIKAGQRINVYVENHQKKSGTPTMGGLIFIIPTIVTILILLFTKKIKCFYRFFNDKRRTFTGNFYRNFQIVFVQ